jgi:hypothetical protein
MNLHMSVLVVGAVILSSGLVPSAGGAQAAPLSAAVSGLVPIPVGPLINNRSVGVGATAALRYAPATVSWLCIRFELSGLPSSSHDPGGDAQLDEKIENGTSALFATAGPEFDIPAGRGHFYTTATGGAARLWESSSRRILGATPGGINGSAAASGRATNFAWSGGGGFVMPLSSGRSPVSADFGVRYYDLGDVTYTTPYAATSLPSPNPPTIPPPTIRHHQATMIAPSIGLTWRL